MLSSLAPAEWLRPWKLASFAVGMAWLIWGAVTLDIGDWDIGVSILMGGFTYLLAPCCARIVMRRHWKILPIALFFWWWCVDGVYMAWHLAVGNPTFRDANFYASSCLFWLCGFIWLPKASLRQIVLNPHTVSY
jgi:hypothetical protein